MRLDFKNYLGIRPDEIHPHAQFVLALEGAMEMEVAGRAARLHSDYCAFVPTGVLHSQLAEKESRFLVVNCAESDVGLPLAAHLAGRIFLPVGPAARQLLAFAESARQQNLPLETLSAHWARLLVASLAPQALAAVDSRLAKLILSVENSLDLPWTVPAMADKAGLSQSRLYALFQEKFKSTPQDWLAGLRVNKARQWLAETDMTIAEMAQRLGYSDQSALTRAMRRLAGVTPAAYRKEQQELWSKSQE